MRYEISVGAYKVGMLDKVEIHRSVELLADTAEITLPAAQYGTALEVEDKIHRGDAVLISFGYEETGLVEEFRGWLQRVVTDGGRIRLVCEDDLFLFRKSVGASVLLKTSLRSLLDRLLRETGLDYVVSCSYDWTYDRFVINNATAFDVLKKVQEESGADIYLKGDVLHLHPPGEVVGSERFYDFGLNVEGAELEYRKLADRRIQVTVKANLPNGYVREVECGRGGGERVEVKCPTSDEASMKARGELELRRRSFDGYDGSITTWLIPECVPGDTATLHDGDYPQKDGTYFVRSVTTSFSKEGGRRKVELGFRLS